MMKKSLIFLIALGGFTLSACAARQPGIVIDPKGVDMGRYHQDLAECVQLAEQVPSKALKGAVGGAAVGAIAGDIIGNRRTTQKGAKLGALGGTLRGARATRLERQRVVKNCLRHRGYAVLN